MITLAIFEQMDADGVANLEKNKNFFWEQMPLRNDGKPAEGVWLATRGGESDSPNGCNLRTTIDIYVSFANKVKTEAVHAAIRKWISENPCFCHLNGEIESEGETYSYGFSNVRLFQTETPRIAGANQNGNIVKMASILTVYDLEN